jgi:hypothetical protein
MMYGRARKRAPGDFSIFLIVGNLGIPFEPERRWNIGNPMRLMLVGSCYGLQVGHKTRQILNTAPHAINLLDRLMDGDTFLNLRSVFRAAVERAVDWAKTRGSSVKQNLTAHDHGQSAPAHSANEQCGPTE